MLVFLCLCLHLENYRQLCTKCIHRKGITAAARSCQPKPVRARIPCHLSVCHCVYAFIYMCNCLGSPFYKKIILQKNSLLHWIEKDNKSWSAWNTGGGYAYLIRAKGALCIVRGFMFSTSVSL